MMCLPTVTRPNWHSAQSAPWRRLSGPPGAVLKVSCMPVSIPAEPALLGQRYVPFTALRRPAVIMNE